MQQVSKTTRSEAKILWGVRYESGGLKKKNAAQTRVKRVHLSVVEAHIDEPLN
jgi:hypothetical protein